LHSRIRWSVIAATVLLISALPAVGWADHDNRAATDNITALGHSPYVPPTDGPRIVNSDLAFWGNRAYQGTYNGFRIIDITDPAAPAELITYEGCEGNQGDVMIWETLLIRTWNGPAPADDPETPETDESVDCGGEDVPAGFEGLHFFDVSDPANPDLIHSVDISDARMEADFNTNGCGSHTATLVPDIANDRLLVYNSGSSSSCTGFEIVDVPLDDVPSADVQRREALGRQCHDVAVFLGDVMRGVCAGGNGFTVFRMNPDAAGNGSLDNPQTIHNSGPIPDVSIGHAAAFTWDGEHFAFGHEPGGGTQAECEEQDPDRFRTLWVYETETGDEVGKWTMPRTQSAVENCTIHNFNFVPTTDGSDILVLGNYQAGTWVVDLTDPTNATTVAFADPDPVDPNNLTAAGAWSSYWYNGFIWESEETKGFNVFELDDPVVDNVAEDFAFLNPQTLMGRIGQEITASSRLNLLHRGQQPHRFSGTVKSAEGSCVAGRNVVIKKVRSGPDRDRVVARDTTNAGGNYSAAHNQGGAGRYYAVAKDQTVMDGIDEITCLRAQSATKSFGR
jgi:LVIVD repeat